MKFSKNITHKHPMDCWCSALTLSTGLQYDTIYKQFKPFLERNGGAQTPLITSYLRNKGYMIIEVDIDLKDALLLYNTDKQSRTVFLLNNKDNEQEGHVIYVRDKVIYDDMSDIDYKMYLDSFTVERVCIYECTRA